MKKHLLFKILLCLSISIFVNISTVSAADPEAGDIIITEYMADPNAVGDTDGEYFELYNTTGSTIDIDGWTVKDDGANTHTITTANGTTIVPAYGFLILGRGNGSYNNRDYEITMALGNSDDEIVLVYHGTVDVEICRVNYLDGAQHGVGVACELNNIANHTSGVTLEANYVASETALSSDFGSPGTAGKTALESIPPTWTVSYPVTANVSATNLDLVVNIDEAGTAYYVVLADGATAPTSAQVKAGTDASDTPVALSGSIAIAAGLTDYTENIAGLTAITAYDIYVVAEDDEGTPNIQVSAMLVNVSTLILKVEPENQATGLTESDKTLTEIILTWTDAAVGAQAPDAYIIKAEAGDGSGIVAPADATDETEGTLIKKVAYSVQTVAFTCLTENTQYTFKMWAYTNSGADINYKLDGIIQEVSVTTPESFILETFDADLGHWNIYNESGDTKEWIHNTDHANCNGFDSGELEIDWLISPVLNHSFIDDPNLIFDLWWNTGTDDGSNYLKLYYSTDYNGDTANLGTATWNELIFPTPGSSSTWTTSGGLDISAISGNFYLVFKYHYNSGSYRNWGVDNISLYGTDNGTAVILLQSPLAGSTFDTKENVTVDFVTYNQTDLLTLEVWNQSVDDWEPFIIDINPAAGTIIAQVPANGEEADTYKLRLLDQIDDNPISNEVPFAIDDVTGPVFNSYTPADGSSDVARSQSLQIDFDEDVKAGTGNIIIKQYNSETEVISYPIADAAIVITGTTVTINHTTDWPNDSMLYVEIAAGVILDLQDNADFSVVKDDWNFEIADELAPVYTFNPANAETDVATNATLIISFDETIYELGGSTTPFDNTTIDAIITLKETDAIGDNVTFNAIINGTNDSITITPDVNLNGLSDYYYAISDQYEDASENQGASENVTFTTIDDSDPIVTISPTNGAIDVARENNITIAFDKAVRNLDNTEVVDGDLAAMITLKETDDSGADVDFTATINAAKTSITIDPDATLKASAVYYVAITDELESAADVAIAATNASFTTIDDEAPIAIIDPADAEIDVAINSSILITFDEAIVNTDASAIDDTNVDALIVLKDTDASGTDISFDATIDANKEIITIVPAADFGYNQDVFVSVAAVEDAAANETVLQSVTFTSILNDDATLSDLTVDGTTVTGFDPATYEYNDTLAYGTTDVPTVAATENDPDANVVVTQATNVDGTLAERTATVSVTAEDLSTQDYTVVFAVALNTESDFLTFEIASMDSVVFNNTSDFINVYMPYGTNDDALIPIFTLSPGATANPESGVVTDFSYVVDYRVTAQDGVTFTDWQIAVFVEQAYEFSIYEIQYSVESSGDSPYLSTLAKTYGIVTGVGSSGFFMQDSAAAWNGIYINSDFTATRGDSVTVVGYVEEFQDGTMLTDVLEYTVHTAGATLPDALVLTVSEAIDEKHEGVLVTINNIECTIDANALNEYTFADENDYEIIVDDILYNHTFTLGNIYSITGIRQSYYGNKLCPRDVNDINEAPSISGITLNPTTPASTDDVTITATITDDDVAAALTIGLFHGFEEGSEDTEVTFSQVGTSDDFEGTIPASSSTVYYKITANDGTMDSEHTSSYSITVGINNPDGIVSMNIYPNPSNGNFTLEMNASKAGTFNVQIINIQGQVVFTKEINQDGFYKETIDISNNASGIYYLRINDGKNLKVSKIMIQ